MGNTKANQRLKYLNTTSTHPPVCFKAVTTGVFHRLAHLTTITSNNKNVPIHKLYPLHANALREAGYSVHRSPLLKHAFHRAPKRSMSARRIAATKFLVLGYSEWWKSLDIPKVIARLLNLLQLSDLLSVHVSYRHFPHVDVLFKKDISKKVLGAVTTIQGITRPCNCVNECILGGNCRMTSLVYRITVKSTGKMYIGSTSGSIKGRILQHLHCVQKASRFYISHGSLDPVTVRGVSRGPGLTYSFPTYLIKEILIPIEWRGEIPARPPLVSYLCDLLHFDILWQGNPITLGPTYGTTDCVLCLKEAVLTRTFRARNPSLMINTPQEAIYCRHKVASGSPTLVTESGAEEAD